ncbi:hypothetical protein Tco_0438116 [Tanacetum coccineum]
MCLCYPITTGYVLFERRMGYSKLAMMPAESEAEHHTSPIPLTIQPTIHTLPTPKNRTAAPTSSGHPPLHLLSTDHREDRPEVTLPPQKRLGIALGPSILIGASSSAARLKLREPEWRWIR